MEEIKRIGDLLNIERIGSCINWTLEDLKQYASYIPKFNKALKELDDETALKNRTTIRLIKYKLKMIRKYAVGPSPMYGGMKEEEVEQIFDKECKIKVIV